MGFRRGGGQIDPTPQHILVFKYPSRDRVFSFIKMMSGTFFKGIFPSANSPRVFSLVATSQMCISQAVTSQVRPSHKAWCIIVFYPKRLAPLVHSSHSAQPHCSLRRLKGNLSLGKSPWVNAFGKIHNIIKKTPPYQQIKITYGIDIS